MDLIISHRDVLLQQLSTFQNMMEQLQKENRALEEEVNLHYVIKFLIQLQNSDTVVDLT